MSNIHTKTPPTPPIHSMIFVTHVQAYILRSSAVKYLVVIVVMQTDVLAATTCRYWGLIRAVTVVEARDVVRGYLLDTIGIYWLPLRAQSTLS